MIKLSITERIEQRLETALAAFDKVEVKAELASINDFAKVGTTLSRWAKAAEDTRAAGRRADLIGDRAEAQLYALMLKANPPANDSEPQQTTDEAGMDDHGNPTTPEELEQHDGLLVDRLAELGMAPEQKAFRNRAQRRRVESPAKHVVVARPHGSTRA